MLFGLFGGRNTTDDTIEQIAIQADYDRGIHGVALRQIKHNTARAMEDWDDAYLAQISELRDELQTAEARIKDLERERENLLTTGVHLALSRRAYENTVTRDANSEALIEVVNAETQRLLRVEAYIAVVRSELLQCAKKAFWIAKK